MSTGSPTVAVFELRLCINFRLTSVPSLSTALDGEAAAGAAAAGAAGVASAGLVGADAGAAGVAAAAGAGCIWPACCASVVACMVTIRATRLTMDMIFRKICIRTPKVKILLMVISDLSRQIVSHFYLSECAISIG